jgi:hypothetical protein
MTADLDLQSFLSRERLVVIDIVRGAVPGCRRLVLGGANDARPTHVVAISSDSHGWEAVDSELRLLSELGRRLRPSLRDTVPAVVRTVTVGEEHGVVLTALPGAGSSRSSEGPGSVRDQAVAVLDWLMMMWQDTAEADGPVDLGREACDVMLATFAASRGASAMLGVVYRSRSALAHTTIPKTVTHGCLCPQHVRFSNGRVVGVDDWGLARFGQDPLRDVGMWVVASAGPRIGVVLTGSSRTSRTWQQLVADALGYWGVPAELWRDVLVLCLAEAAVAGLAQDDTTTLDLFSKLARKMSDADHRLDVTS